MTQFPELGPRLTPEEISARNAIVQDQSDFLLAQLAQIEERDHSLCCPVKTAEATALGYARVEDYVAVVNATNAASEQGFATVADYLAACRGTDPLAPSVSES